MEDQSAGLICTIYNDEEWEKELPIMNLIIFEKKRRHYFRSAILVRSKNRINEKQQSGASMAWQNTSSSRLSQRLTREPKHIYKYKN